MIVIAEEYRSAIIAMLIRMMAADGRKDRNEFAFILQVAHELGMTPDDFQALTPDIFTKAPALPSSEKERMIILYYLLFIMKTDGIVTQEEENLVKELGHQLGFRIELVSDLARVIKTNPPFSAPTDEMLNEIRRYLN
jgi:uncharacterized tellurite resistance protein B-like protein